MPSSCTTVGLFVERSTRIEPAGAVVVHSSATWRTASGDGSDIIVISAAFPTAATDAAASAPSTALHAFGVDVVHRDLVTVGDEVVGDVAADVAEPDHSDAHCCPPAS